MKRRMPLLFRSLSILLALGSGAIFVQGLMRDYYTGDPVVRFDPRQKTDWIAASFRVWGRGSYALRISSVNHNPDLVGRLLEGEFEVLVTDPHEKLVLRKTYRPASIAHRVPNNYGDTLLDGHYAMIVPAGLFLVVAMILSSLLAGGATFTPLVLSFHPHSFFFLFSWKRTTHVATSTRFRGATARSVPLAR